MASQIRKGFFFYFGLFVLVLLAVFMVCVVIMIFNPGSSILWLEYFSGNETTLVTETTDGTTLNASSAIDYSSISNIEIDCGYAEVTVSFDSTSSKFTKSGIYIVNNAKGFVASSAATDFEFSVSYEDPSTLVISVTEPNGFLYFSKDVQIVVHSSTKDENPVNFSNINFKISTNSGDVCIGGTGGKAEADADLELSELTVKSESGDIFLSQKLNTESVSAMKLTTSRGTIYSNSQFASYSDSNTTTTGIKANCSVELVTDSGRIELSEINLGTANTLTITNISGNVVLGNVIADILDFAGCDKGNYALTEFWGDYVTFSSGDISAPYLAFGTINGSFLVNGTTSSSKPDMNINKVTGDVTVYCWGGSLNIDALQGNMEVNAQGSLAVDVVVTKNSSSIVVNNQSSNITLTFTSNMTGNDVKATTNSGNIVINFKSTAKFVATSYSTYVEDGSESNVKLADKKITLNIGDSSANKNPFSFNEQSTCGALTLVTNSGKVNFNLV